MGYKHFTGIYKNLYGTRIHRIWTNMKTRCSNEKAPDYHRYGGRGIRVCERWQEFTNFYDDMIDGYSDDLSLDRIDNDADYEPSNCRWATPKEQANNTRNIKNAHHFTYDGKTLTIREWAELFDIKRRTLSQRLLHYNIPIEAALFRKVG